MSEVLEKFLNIRAVVQNVGLTFSITGEDADDVLDALQQANERIAKLEVAVEAVGDGGDLEEAAQLLQDATTIHGVNQTFAQNPYAMSDRLRKMAQAIADTYGNDS